MPYSSPLMTLIFIKPNAERARAAAAKMDRGAADTRFDVRRLYFRSRVIEATYPANTCVSTPSLCNANFARS
jgi:hypothetical protein